MRGDVFLRFGFLVVISLIYFLGQGFAADQYKLYIVKGTTVSIPAPDLVEEIAIDNPAIADVKLWNKEILVSGKAEGKTVLTVFSQGIMSKYSVIVWERDLDLVASKLKAIISSMGLAEKVNMKKDKGNGVIYLTGEVFSDDEMKEIEQAVSACGEMVVINLVRKKMIEDSIRLSLNIMEVSHSALRELGIQWPQEIQFSSSEVNDPSANGTTFSDTLRFNIWDRTAINLTVSALESKGKAKLLATPNILAENGKAAKIVVGGEVPIPQRSGGDISVEYKPYGVVLDMTPTILRAGLRLNVKCEVSEIDDANSVRISYSDEHGGTTVYDLPAFITRKTNTVVTIKDGDTLVLGGLLKNSNSKTVSSLPGVAKLPILGELFKSKEFNSGKTELVITISPKVVRLVQDSSSKTKNQGFDSKKAFDVNDDVGDKEVDSMDEYLAILKDRLSTVVEKYRNKYLKGKKGRVVISLHLNNRGKILAVRVMKTSGDPVMDRVALMCVRDVGSFPPLPESIDVTDLWIDVPVCFVDKVTK